MEFCLEADVILTGMKLSRLVTVLLLLAVAFSLLRAGVNRWRRDRQGRIYSDFEAEVRLRGVLDVSQLARSLERRLRRPFTVVEPARGAPPAIGRPMGAFSVGVLHVSSYERMRESRPLKLLYWLPEPNERELLMVRAAGGLPDGKRVVTTPACAGVARRWIGLLGHLPSQLQVRDVLHDGLPDRDDGDVRPFRWGGVLAQSLLDCRADFLIAERRRLRAETLPAQRARLRVLAAVVPPSPFLLAAPLDVSPELLDALKEVLPSEISAPWALPAEQGAAPHDAVPLLLSRAMRRYTTPAGGVPFEEACP